MGSRLWLGMLAPVAACSFTPGTASNRRDDASTDSIMLDVRADTPAGQLCVGAGLYVECFVPGTEPTNTYDPPPGSTFDTDLGPCDEVVPQTGGPDLCVIRAATMTVSNDIALAGARPLVMLAIDTITIHDSTDLDFSYVMGPTFTTGCNASAGGNDTGGGASAGAGGGGGGGFGGGGAGGSAGQGTGGGGGGGGGIGAAVIRGGCPGAKGGTSSDGAGGGGGSPGGALYLMAGTSITIIGNLLVDGGGGSGGPNKAGGGGGGTGGFIGLDAPTVTLESSADLVANGGAGGEGGGAGSSGEAGENATAWDARPDGGSANSNGSNGGNGSYNVTTAPTAGGTGGDGGGGGGGGFGVIRVYAHTFANNTTQVSPGAVLTTIP